MILQVQSNAEIREASLLRNLNNPLFLQGRAKIGNPQILRYRGEAWLKAAFAIRALQRCVSLEGLLQKPY